MTTVVERPTGELVLTFGDSPLDGRVSRSVVSRLS